ncbi:MAG: hypothetical protein JXB30_16900 [Anaerolineae bacterium]|nr:hypothetical protein [Anaerolineae bacterium]
MSGQAKDGQSDRPGKQLKRKNRQRRRRLLQVGGLPFTLMMAACLLLVVNGVFISKAPSWVTDPDEYLLGQRILGTLGTLTGLHLIGTWLLGLLGAAMAGAAAAGQGGMLRQRLTVLHRRTMIVAWAVFLLRWILLAALIVSAILADRYISNVSITGDDYFNVFGVEWVISVVALVTLLIHLLSGPFLRLRYSMAVGALGATWSRQRRWRLLAAVTARTAAGLLGSVALLWGGVFGILIILTIRQPLSHSLPIDFHQIFFPALSWSMASSLLFLLGLTVLIWLYVIGQLVLPFCLLWLARWRLAHRVPVAERHIRRWEVASIEEAALPSASVKAADV